MTSELANVPLHEEIMFFRPMLESTRELLDLCVQRRGIRIKPNLYCFYVPVKGQRRPLLEVYLVPDEWESLRHYFMGKAPLLFFFEPRMEGLVNKDATFWIFSKFTHLKDLCFRERLKLNEMTPQAVKKLPYQNVELHFQKQIGEMLHDESKLFSTRAQECEKILKLAQCYLPKIQAAEIQQLARILLKIGLHHEIEEIIRILKDNVMVDQTKLKKRMRAVHTLSMKYYFFRAADEEKQKLDSLVGRDKGGQLKALQYIEGKVSRSFSINHTKDQLEKLQKEIETHTPPPDPGPVEAIVE
ncbi:hypothetical protein WDW89_00620 [Deltaproteobacteria bacterium TL4]